MSKASWLLAALAVAFAQPVQAAWTETVLADFSAGSLGSYDGLVFDGKGNLYGTNVASGAKGYGSVFKLTR